ncbi:MAG: DNA-binding MarR family transcriptional regulator [Bacteriovoracaceae bacterium]
MKNIERVNNLLDTQKIRSWRALFNAFKFLSAEFESSLLELGCSVPRFQILLHLHTTGPHTPVTLSRLLKVSRANITTFLKRLQEDNLIKPTLENGSEKRPAYELTKTGIKFFEEVLPAHTGNVERLMTPFPEEFIKLLEEIPNNS